MDKEEEEIRGAAPELLHVLAKRKLQADTSIVTSSDRQRPVRSADVRGRRASEREAVEEPGKLIKISAVEDASLSLSKGKGPLATSLGSPYSEEEFTSAMEIEEAMTNVSAPQTEVLRVEDKTEYPMDVAVEEVERRISVEEKVKKESTRDKRRARGSGEKPFVFPHFAASPKDPDVLRSSKGWCDKLDVEKSIGIRLALLDKGGETKLLSSLTDGIVMLKKTGVKVQKLNRKGKLATKTVKMEGEEFVVTGGPLTRTSSFLFAQIHNVYHSRELKEFKEFLSGANLADVINKLDAFSRCVSLLTPVGDITLIFESEDAADRFVSVANLCRGSGRYDITRKSAEAAVFYHSDV